MRWLRQLELKIAPNAIIDGEMLAIAAVTLFAVVIGMALA